MRYRRRRRTDEDAHHDDDGRADGKQQARRIPPKLTMPPPPPRRVRARSCRGVSLAPPLHPPLWSRPLSPTPTIKPPHHQPP